MSYFDKEKNQRERIKFIEFWANYIRTHSDKEWSRQQKVLIDSQVNNAKKQLITVKQYLEIKETVKRLMSEKPKIT